MRGRIRLLCLVAALFVTFVLLPLSHIRAGSISIAPLRQELTLKPGEAFSSKLFVQNSSKVPATVHLGAQTFKVSDENYDYAFAKTENAQDWVSFDETSLPLNPRENTPINYTVGVPVNAEPGGKYIAVFASTSDKPVNNITSVDRVGLLLYITVAGNVTRRGNVLALGMPIATLGHQDTWSVRLANKGTAHFRSRLTVNVANIFGHTIGTDTADHLILPSSVRLIQGNAKFSGWPGLYRVRFSVGRGDDTALFATRWVLYAPVWWIIFVLCIVILIGARIVKLVHKQQSRQTKSETGLQHEQTLEQEAKTNKTPTKATKPSAKKKPRSKPKTKVKPKSRTKASSKPELKSRSKPKKKQTKK